MDSMEAYKAHAVVDELVASSRPGPAIHALAEHADDASASPFERYAASVLRDAGALQVTAPGCPELRLHRVTGSQLVRLNAGAGPQADRKPARVLEDALNRLTGIVAALDEGVGSHVPASPESGRARRRELFERHGLEYPLWSDTERGAHVVLPPMPRDAQSALAYYNEIDWRMLDTVANNAHVFFQAAILTNRHQVIFGVKAPHCSEWDVRTRLASVLAGLEPPLRLTFRFDCDTGRGTAAVRFDMPPAESFPAHVIGRDGALEPVGNRIGPARLTYALRIAALVGAACFGSGRIVEHALVVGCDADGRSIASCAFDRTRFVQETLPAIDAGLLGDPALRFDHEAVADALSANHAGFTLAASSPLAMGNLEGMRVNPWEDNRILPDDMQRLFHAKRVMAVDTSHYLGESAQVIDAAKADSADSLVAAIAQLENAVAEMEHALAPPEDDSDARPLYCGSALSRAAIALLDDDLNVGAEAEAFLHPDEDAVAPALPDIYYCRAPDALFHAHVGLADLYRKLGDVRGAEAQADRCMALAPTMPVGYALKADALAGQGRFREALNVLRDGLSVAVAETDQAFLLHDLALLLGRMGRYRESRVLHAYTASLSGVYAAKSAEYAGQLAEDGDVRAFMRKHMPMTADVLGELEVSLVSERTRNALIAKAALGLSNAHAPLAAAPYVALVAQRFPTNRTIAAACNSIIHGLS